MIQNRHNRKGKSQMNKVDEAKTSDPNPTNLLCAILRDVGAAQEKVIVLRSQLPEAHDAKTEGQTHRINALSGIFESLNMARHYVKRGT